jgi:hypothetical protein
LNVNKALSKKLEATKRKQNIEYIFKEGGIVRWLYLILSTYIQCFTAWLDHPVPSDPHLRYTIRIVSANSLFVFAVIVQPTRF